MTHIPRGSLPLSLVPQNRLKEPQSRFSRARFTRQKVNHVLTWPDPYLRNTNGNSLWVTRGPSESRDLTAVSFFLTLYVCIVTEAKRATANHSTAFYGPGAFLRWTIILICIFSSCVWSSFVCWFVWHFFFLSLSHIFWIFSSILYDTELDDVCAILHFYRDVN